MSFVVAFDHPCLPGHFPGRPLVPGVVLLEQAVAAIEARHGALRAMRLPQVKFVQPLMPGETARVEIDGAAPRWRFRVMRDDTLLASGEVVAEEAIADETFTGAADAGEAGTGERGSDVRPHTP